LLHGGADVEWVLHFNPVNTWYENTRYEMGGPIAAFILAAVRIRRDNHQYGRSDETATNNGVSHIHDRTPAGSSQMPNKLR
jgi:hypothetical protein